jgi:peptidoglycan LD-endopeptidase CwlK
MSRALDDLVDELKLKSFEHFARCLEYKVPILIVDTLRTKAEQEIAVNSGVSWTYNSLHLPDKNGKARAYDICPYLVYQSDGPDKLNWDEKHPHWQIIGKIGEGLGLKWGVIKRGKRIDLGHFELKRKS